MLPEAMPHTPQSVAAAAYPPDDAGELNLSHLHGLLIGIKQELIRLQDIEPPEIVETFRYLKAKDAERAGIVIRDISTATSLLSEAAALVDECIHWSNVKAQLRQGDPVTDATPAESPAPAAPHNAPVIKPRRSVFAGRHP